MSFLAYSAILWSFMLVLIEITEEILSLGFRFLQSSDILDTYSLSSFMSYLHYIVYPIMDLSIGSTIILVFYFQAMYYRDVI